MYIFLRDLAFHKQHNPQNVDEEGSKCHYQPFCHVSIAGWPPKYSMDRLYSTGQQLEHDGTAHDTMDISFDLVRQCFLKLNRSGVMSIDICICVI